MCKRFTWDARQVVVAADGEAARRGDPSIGTQHLLIGLVADPVGVPARALGIDANEVRRALLRLDRDALASVGVDPDLADVTAPVAPRARVRRRMSWGARGVLAAALQAAVLNGDSRLESRHLLLGLLDADPRDTAISALRILAVDVDAVRASLVRPRAA